jgi:hypothetical protein
MLNFCSIVVAILKMATGRNFSMSGHIESNTGKSARHIFAGGPVPIFSHVRFSYLALVQDKKNHVRFTGKCMLYSLCQLPPNSPCFTFLK